MRKTAAFTLIELLVVITIIALLTAVLLPALHRVTRQARAAACQSNLHQWATMFAMYSNDNDGRFFTFPLIYYWPQLMASYHPDSNDIRCCPAATKFRSEDGRPQLGDKFTAWGSAACYSSYGLSGWFMDGPFTPDPNDPAVPWNWMSTFTGNAASVPLFFDCISAWATPYTDDDPPPVEGAHNSYMACICIDRHTGGINCLFRDSSVRKVGLKELWLLKWHQNYNIAGRWTRTGGIQPQDWPPWMRKFKDY